jgi:hypothetical protein
VLGGTIAFVAFTAVKQLVRWNNPVRLGRVKQLSTKNIIIL